MFLPFNEGLSYLAAPFKMSVSPLWVENNRKEGERQKGISNIEYRTRNAEYRKDSLHIKKSPLPK